MIKTRAPKYADFFEKFFPSKLKTCWLFRKFLLTFQKIDLGALVLYLVISRIQIYHFLYFSDFTRFHLEFVRIGSTSKFERIIVKLANQLRELECPATVLTYLSFNQSYPLMNLERLRLQYLSNTDPGKLLCWVFERERYIMIISSTAYCFHFNLLQFVRQDSEQW